MAGSMPFELTTIDLYSSRSRVWFAKLCADLFGAAEELIKEDIGKILTLVEAWKPEQARDKAQRAEQSREGRSASIFKKPGYVR